jgi:hypothetical protein
VLFMGLGSGVQGSTTSGYTAALDRNLARGAPE